MSAAQLARTIGVSAKTGWYLPHRIRAAMTDDGTLLNDTVEMDETYVGGKVQGRGRACVGNKALVLGAVERGGQVRIKPAYIDELEWRYNNRRNPYLFRDTLIRLCESEVLTYETLVA